MAPRKLLPGRELVPCYLHPIIFSSRAAGCPACKTRAAANELADQQTVDRLRAHLETERQASLTNRLIDEANRDCAKAAEACRAEIARVDALLSAHQNEQRAHDARCETFFKISTSPKERGRPGLEVVR